MKYQWLVKNNLINILTNTLQKIPKGSKLPLNDKKQVLNSVTTLTLLTCLFYVNRIKLHDSKLYILMGYDDGSTAI